jgi:hypothetical protein
LSRHCTDWYILLYTMYRQVYTSIDRYILRYTVMCRISWSTSRCNDAWIGENLQDELGFADKADKRAAAGSGWTPAELNHILQAHVVDGALTTFGCVEWESDLYRGTMRARCYPFDMPKRRFHSFNPKVCHSVLCTSYLHIPYSLWYILVYTKLNVVYTSIY